MTKIMFGLKLWSINRDIIGKAIEIIEDDIFHYIELTPIPNTEITPFLESNLPYIIHITTERYGVNIADTKKKQFNVRAIQNCIEWADKLDAQYLILHPGFGMIESTIDFLSDSNDRRFLIENMPKVGLNGERMIGYTPEQMKKLIANKFGLCLDLNHAIKAAVSLRKSYKEFIEEFLKLDPTLFHVSDGKLNNEKDEHLDIDAGDYDFEFLMSCVNEAKSKCMTLETPRTNLNSLNEDFKNLERLMLWLTI